MLPNDTMTVAEASRYLAMDEQAVSRLAAERRIPAIQRDGEWVFSKKSIDKWAAPPAQLPALEPGRRDVRPRPRVGDVAAVHEVGQPARIETGAGSRSALGGAPRLAPSRGFRAGDWPARSPASRSASARPALDRDRAPRGHGRVLRVRRAARPARAPRPAGGGRGVAGGRGVVSAASYEARRSACTRRCPSAGPFASAPTPPTCRWTWTSTPQVSREIMAILAEFTPLRRARVDRRGLPRRHREPARCSATGPAVARASRTRIRAELAPDGVRGRGRQQVRRQGRLRPREAGRPRGGAGPGARRRFLAPAPGGAALGRGPGDRGRARGHRASGPSASSPPCPPTLSRRRLGAMRAGPRGCSRAAATTVRWSPSRRAEVHGRRGDLRGRPPATSSACGRPCAGRPSASPASCAREGYAGTHGHAQAPLRRLLDPHAAAHRRAHPGRPPRSTAKPARLLDRIALQPGGAAHRALGLRRWARPGGASCRSSTRRGAPGAARPRARPDRRALRRRGGAPGQPAGAAARAARAARGIRRG